MMGPLSERSILKPKVMEISSVLFIFKMGFSGSSVVKNLPADAGDTDFIPDPG